jgi:carboxypeptidase D
MNIIRFPLNFVHRAHICGYDFNLTYPQTGKFPPVRTPVSPMGEFRATAHTRQSFAFMARRLKALAHASAAPEVGIIQRSSIPTHEEVAAREEKRQTWLSTKRNFVYQRDLNGRANGTLDPWYGCDLVDELIDYALNFSLPWS